MPIPISTMKITSKNNASVEIQTVDELHKFLIYKQVRTIKNVIYFPIHIYSKLEQLISTTQEISLFQLKNFVKKLFGRTSFRTVRYWIDRGYSLEEGNIEISKHQRKNSLKLAEYKKQNPKKYECSTPKNIKYWIIKGYSEEEAKKIISESQHTFSLQKCKNKHGESEGTKIWQNRQTKWLNSLFNKSTEEIQATNISKGKTYEQMIQKHGLEKADQIRESKIITYDKMCAKYGEEKADKWLENRLIHIVAINPKKVSKISLELFNEIMTYPFKDKQYIMYGDNEMCIKNPDKKFYLFDFAVNSDKTKKVIEFHGDFIHANPKTYLPTWFHPLKKITAQEIWRDDKLKQKKVEDHGFECIVIWESEFKANKIKTIHKCLQFLNE